MRRFTKIVLLAVVIFAAGILVKASITQPATGSWLSAGSMSEPRNSAASALLQDGRILITGGDNGSGPVASAEFFDTTGTFVAAPPMSTPRSTHSATVLADGRILVAGGSTGTAATNAAEIFDPVLNSWAPIAGGMIQARSNHTASLLADGRVLFAGGENAGTPTALLEIFDPVAGSFSSVGVMSSPRTSFASAVLSDGRVMLIGGSNGSMPVASTEIFDPLTNLVSAGPALSAPRMSHSATTLLDGRVLVVGGTNLASNADGSTTPTDLASAEIYDPATASFSVSASSLAAPRRDHAAFLLPNNNSVLIVGGTSSGNEVGTAEMFVPSTGTFAPTGSPAAARQHATGTALKRDGILFLAGGSNSTGTLSSAELYGFATVKTDKADYAPGTVVTITGSGWQPGETITLTLVESPLVDTHPVMTAVADSTGKFVNTDFSPDEHDISIRFYLTAVGSISGIQAQNTFTDGNVTSLSGTVRSNAAGNPPISGATITCTAGCNNSPAASTTSGTTGAYVFDNSTTKLSFATNGPVAITLTASAPGFNSAALTLSNVNNGNTFTGEDFTLTPSVSGTTTTVASSPNPSTYGGSVTFTATVARLSGTNTPTGTVSIKDGATAICTTGILSGGSGTATASCAVSTLAVSGSPHSVTAVYGGDGNFTGSTSIAISQTVNAAPVTVTFTASDKPYDGTTTATVSNCVISTGKVGTDDVTCTVANGTFASANAGASAQTVSATATLSGTKASNYAVTNPVTTTAKINGASVTVTFTASDKPYDGTTTATVSNCVIATGKVGTDDVTCTVANGTFASANASASVQTVSATATLSGTKASNYAVTNPVTTTAKINPVPVSVTVTDPMPTYDGTPHAATATATGVGGATVTGSFSFTYDGSSTVPTNAKASYAVVATFTSSDGNYANVTANGLLTIAKADSSTVVSVAGGESFTYDGLAHPATVAVTGVGGLNQSPAPVYSCGHAPINVLDSGCTASYSFAGDDNHKPSSDSKTYTIAKADSSTVVSVAGGESFTYDGLAHPATVAVTGVGGLNQSPAPVYSCGHAPINVLDSGCTASYNFAGDDNHKPSSDSKTYTIAKADSSTVVSVAGGESFTYDGLAHPATVAVTGVGGLNQSPAPVYSCGHAPINVLDSGCTASYNFAGDDNHKPSSDSKTYTIAKADSSTVVSVAGGESFTYDGLAHPATVAVTGVGGLNQSPAPVYSCGHAPINVLDSGCTASYSFAGDDNHKPSSDSKTYTIAKADSSTVVSVAGGESFTYDGLAHPATVAVTGVGGLNQSPAPVYSCGHAPINVLDSGCTASYSFAGDDNHKPSSDSKTYTIAKADSSTVVSVAGGESFTYDGLAHPATVAVTGVGGLNQSPAPVYSCGHAPINVLDSGCTASYNFAGDDNHKPSSDSKTYTIAKADSSTVVSVAGGESFTYDGLAHPATVAVTGVGGLNQSPAPVYSCSHAPINVLDSGCTASYSFAGDDNHKPSSDSKTYTIAKADSSTVVSVAGGESFTYDGLAHPATVAVTGVGGLNQSPAPVYSCGHAPINVLDSGCTASYSFVGDDNHKPSSNSKTYTIAKATANITVMPYSLVYDAGAHTATGTAKGALGETLSGLNLAGTTHTNAGDYPADAWTFTDVTGNYNNASNTVHDSIAKANATIVVTPYGVAYDGTAHTATGSAKGVLNESLSGLNLSGTTHTNPGDYLTDPWTFTDVTGNYNNASGTVHDGIGYGMCSASVGPGGVILPPINSDGTSVYNRKGGSTIPVKFRVCNASGASISNPALVFAGTGGTLTMLSAVRGTIDDINETTGTDIPDVAFRWDGQQWIFNMATNNLTSGSTYAFRINLAYAPASITFVVGVK